MFKGTYPYKIDPKGRLPVPAAFRRLLSEQGAAGVVVTLMDECLAVYAPAEWQRLEHQLLALPAFNKSARALTRHLASRAADCELDVQGRILLPPQLRQQAGLEREATIVGVLNRFEVWAPATWERFLRESERLLDDASLDIQWPAQPNPQPTASTSAGVGALTPLSNPSRGPRPDPGSTGEP